MQCPKCHLTMLLTKDGWHCYHCGWPEKDFDKFMDQVNKMYFEEYGTCFCDDLNAEESGSHLP